MHCFSLSRSSLQHGIILVAACFAVGCTSDSAVQERASDQVHSTTAPAEISTEPSLQYEVLREWKPNQAANGFGAEILLLDDIETVSEDELVTFVESLAGDHDPVSIRVFSSAEAYKAEQAETYGEPYAAGYILMYVRNKTGRGAYGGFDEIRWMQQTGPFAEKFGETTKLTGSP